MHRRSFLAIASAAPFAASFDALAQQPAVTRLLVGATPGGGTDIVARSLALEMSKKLGRQFVVDNRPGAAGNIAATAVARAQADGTTLLLSYTSHVINATLYPSLPFDPVKDFTPLSAIASSPAFVVANPAFPANNIKELLALAREKPGKLNIAIAGIGSANHLAGETLKLEAGVDIVSVPYKGTGPAISDVMAGQIDLAIAGVATVQQLIKGGKLKALGVTSLRRLPAYPDVPAVAETLPGFDYNSWYGLFGPAHMDRALAEQLSAAARDALTSPEMRQRLLTEGLLPIGSSTEEFAKFVPAEISRWGKIVKATGAKPE